MSPELLKSDTILENLEAAIIVIDRECVIQRVNISTESLFEQSRRMLVGLPLRELFNLDDVNRYLRDVLDNNAQYTLREVSIESPSREVLVDITLSIVSNEKGVSPSVLIELYSINRISRFMKEKNQLERQQSFRLMMRGLAHEIKNPLGGLRGAAQLLDRELDDPGQQELTNILIKETDRLTRLVDRVMGSRQQLKLAPLNVHEVLEHVVDIVSARSQGEINIDRNYDPTLPKIHADREQLIQAVLNIVGNAVEAQSESESAHIGLVTEFVRFVTINQTLHKRALKITIWDSGPGVIEELRDILFDPLITGRPEGTGLGLSITQEIIQRHNGSVQLEDCSPNTCFAIYMPYTAEDIASLDLATNSEVLTEVKQ